MGRLLLPAWLALVASGCVWSPLQQDAVGENQAEDPAIGAEQLRAGENRFPVPVDGRFGYIDRSGAVVIEPQFEAAGHFAEGLARVRVGGVWGYIDPQGVLAIRPRYLSASDFAHGRAVVTLPDAPTDIYSRQARGEDRLLRAYINAAGQVAIGAEFTQARDFAETHAGTLATAAHTRVGRMTPFGLPALSFLAATFRTRIVWTGLQPDGTVRFSAPRAETMLAFSDGLAAFRSSPGLLRPRGKWGYVDTRGEVLVAPRFERARPFSEGLAAAALGRMTGYIDTTGAWVVPPTFDDGGPFVEGRARVRVDGRWGFIDRSGARVIEPYYEHANDFSGGLALVTRDGKHGFIHPDGSTAIAFRFDFARPFRNGLAYVRTGSREGYIDTSGSWVWETMRDEGGKETINDE